MGRIKNSSNPINKIIQIYKQNKRFLITAHDNLDGDSIGSGLALCKALSKSGKHAKFLLKTPIPKRYNFLPGIKKFITNKAVLKKYNILFIIDTAGWDQLEGLNANDFKNYTIINIDHHIDNSNFGNINLVDTHASAVGEQIYALLRKLRIPITKDIAACLYTSIVTDTGCFQFTNTTITTYKMAAELIKCGISVADIYEKIYERISLARLKLLRQALNTVKTDMKNRIIWIWITRDMFKNTGADRTDTEGFIDYLKAVDGVKVAVIFKESGIKNEVRVTFRSKIPEIKANEIAHRFNGGGHPAAAGCTVKGNNKEVEKKVLKAVRETIWTAF